MKKHFTIAVLLVLSLLVFYGCLGKKTQQTVQPQGQEQIGTTESQNTQNTQPENPVIKTDERPFAVMIDNEGKARKRHAGLDKAYTIYEMVAEGGETRFLALYRGTKPEAIGPVRSTRHYFTHYAMEHDAILVHIGGSPLGYKAISTFNINDIDGIKGGADGGLAWRNPKTRGDWQNAFTNMERMKNITAAKKYRDKTNALVFKYNQDDFDLTNGKAAVSIKIPYSYNRIAGYQYDQNNKIYKRFLGDDAHTDSLSGVQYTAKNIIIAFVKSYRLNDGPDSNGIDKDRQQLESVGKGKGYYITNGKSVEITWEKSREKEKTIYRDLSGNEIMLNNGQTWIQLVPLYTQDKVQIE